MTISKVFIIICLLYLCGPVVAQLSPSEVRKTIAKIDSASYRGHFDSLQTHTGCNRKVVDGDRQLLGHDRCRDYIFRSFQNYLGEGNVYLHPFSVEQYKGLANVIGVKQGSDRSARIWVLSAHYDTNNNRESDSRLTGCSPGANDNGTGLAALLEIARVLSTIETRVTILFAAWDFEEQFFRGFPAGSNEWFLSFVSEKGFTEWEKLGERGKINLNDLACNLNFDMFGNPRLQSGTNKVLHLCTAFDRKARVPDGYIDLFSYYTQGVTAIEYGNMNFSDHYTFAARNIVAIEHLESDYNNDPFYHTCSDNVDNKENIDFQFAKEVTRGALAYILATSGKPPSSLIDDVGKNLPLIVAENPTGYFSDKSLENTLIYTSDGRKIKLCPEKPSCVPVATQGLYCISGIRDGKIENQILMLDHKKAYFSNWKFNRASWYE
jgi:hypothetical protein